MTFDWETFRAVLLDLDGVLTPTADVHERAWKLTFDEFLHDRLGAGADPFSHDDYLSYVDGKRRYDGVRSFLASRGLALPEGSPADSPAFDSVCAVGNAKNQKFRTVLADEGVRPFPGSIRLLDYLERHDIATAVVTSSANGRDVLDAAGLAHRFEVVVDGLLARAEKLRGKPAPDSFLRAAEELGVEPVHAVVVEDAVSGVAAGVEGRFGAVIGVARDGHGDQLREAGADLVVSDLDELVPS